MEESFSFKGDKAVRMGVRGSGKPPSASPSKIVKDMLEFKAEKVKIAQDKLTKVKERISVKPRKQPPREAAAPAATAAAAAITAAAEEESELKLVHSDSEDIQSESDISNESTDSYGYDEVSKVYGVLLYRF